MGNCACFSEQQKEPKLHLEKPQIIPVVHEKEQYVAPIPQIQEQDQEQEEAPRMKGFVNEENKESVRPSEKASKKHNTVFNFLKTDNKEETKKQETTKEEDVYKDSTNENTPLYSYEGIKKKVKVLRVVDGDTLDVALHHDETNKIFKYRVRLYGIDTPEKRPLKSDPNRDKEIEAAKKSSKAMQDKLDENNNIVVALFYKPDKYGRLLCSIYDKNGNDINEWMIQSGYAYAYYGKTKKSFEEVSRDREE